MDVGFVRVAAGVATGVTGVCGVLETRRKGIWCSCSRDRKWWKLVFKRNYGMDVRIETYRELRASGADWLEVMEIVELKQMVMDMK
ncbi:hypothetical protein C5167_011315 [Papaver somniferum]|uniref:Uncharacterized protein n=1 Tax=Papaver somniferum TaxID=3469 RepID=A0A4Y7K6M4_PAPSO|nr:hypothetical protein C5167_011315 [Papaver somniferum]